MLEVEQILHERYQLHRQLGDNGIRQTWLAKDLQANDNDSSFVVVKLLAFGGKVQWEDLKLFEREAQILQQLNHPRIPKCLDYFSIDDSSLWFALVQRYIPGESLKEKLIKSHRFTEKQVRKIAEDVLSILLHLHKLNPPILHRDIKPSNLIWGEDDEVYLIDFGAVQDKASKEGATFTVVGTYGYAPMEQFGGRAVPASDFYALGTTLIHLLTGIAPADLPQKELRIQFADKVNVNSSFIYWLEKMTEPSPEKRFTTAEDAFTGLKENRVGIRAIIQGVRQPINSRVVVSKSHRNLKIKLPPKTKSSGDVLLYTGGFMFTLVSGLIIMMLTLLFGIGMGNPVLVLFMSPLILAWIAFVDQLLGNVLARQIINITPDFFEIEVLIFNFRRHRKYGRTADIQDVFQSVIHTGKTSFIPSENQSEQEMVTIQTDDRRYSFGLGLSAIECVWLAQEIKDWLKANG